MDFHEKIAVITGASSGIGEETARGLQAAGFTTYAVARRVDRMAGLEADRLKGAFGLLICVVGAVLVIR